MAHGGDSLRKFSKPLITQSKLHAAARAHSKHTNRAKGSPDSSPQTSPGFAATSQILGLMHDLAALLTGEIRWPWSVAAGAVTALLLSKSPNLCAASSSAQRSTAKP